MATGSERRAFGTTLTQAQVDEGLRSYMLRVYNYMGSGLALTGIVAYVVAHTSLYQALFSSGIGFIVMFAPLGIIFFMGSKIKTMKPSTAQTLFWVFSILMGASLSYVVLTYTATSIVRVFFITMVVNIFMQSSVLHFVISVVGVLVFTGLTAYDTQRIKQSYVESDGKDVMTKKAIMGAISLYLNFLNMFMLLLMLFGGGRE